MDQAFDRRNPKPRHHPGARAFMFSTGIENSYPTITGAQGKTVRIDEMEKTGHYRNWKQDFALVGDLGLEFLRWGPPYYLMHLGPGKYDWSFADEALEDLRRRGITVI